MDEEYRGFNIIADLDEGDWIAKVTDEDDYDESRGKTKNARQGIEHRGGMTPAPTGNRCVGARSSRPQGRAAGV